MPAARGESIPAPAPNLLRAEQSPWLASVPSASSVCGTSEGTAGSPGNGFGTGCTQHPIFRSTGDLLLPNPPLFFFSRGWQNLWAVRSRAVEERDTTLFVLLTLHMKGLLVPHPFLWNRNTVTPTCWDLARKVSNKPPFYLKKTQQDYSINQKILHLTAGNKYWTSSKYKKLFIIFKIQHISPSMIWWHVWTNRNKEQC